jgi:hypothetical protein
VQTMKKEIRKAILDSFKQLSRDQQFYIEEELAQWIRYTTRRKFDEYERAFSIGNWSIDLTSFHDLYDGELNHLLYIENRKTHKAPIHEFITDLDLEWLLEDFQMIEEKGAQAV